MIFKALFLIACLLLLVAHVYGYDPMATCGWLVLLLPAFVALAGILLGVLLALLLHGAARVRWFRCGTTSIHYFKG